MYNWQKIITCLSILPKSIDCIQFNKQISVILMTFIYLYLSLDINSNRTLSTESKNTIWRVIIQGRSKKTSRLIIHIHVILA